jgi:hypothetical protein
MKYSHLASETHQAGQPTGTPWVMLGGSYLEGRMPVGTTVRRDEFRPAFPLPVNQRADLPSSAKANRRSRNWLLANWQLLLGVSAPLYHCP